jgi:pimeloyl-ACP methyl ester carboxylesterase
MAHKQGRITLSDGCKLNYLEAGQGEPIVFVPGWSQSAAEFGAQLDDLADRWRVIAIDMRGHGDSDKPTGGYRMSRLGRDMHEAILALDLRNVTIGGHSMGSSIIWSYHDQFGPDRLKRIIIIDQGACLVHHESWSVAERAACGSLFTPKELYDLAVSLAGPDGAKTTEGMVRDMFFTKSYPADRLKWALAENLKMPRRYAAHLLVNHCMQDWRDVIPTIRLPTLVFAGDASFFVPASQAWIADQIPGARLELFGANEGGGHFMFMENAPRFNAAVRAFMIGR